MGEEIFVNDMSNKELISRINKHLIKLNIKNKTTNPVKNG